MPRVFENHPERRPDDVLAEARALYFMGWRLSSISRELGIERTGLSRAKTREKWDSWPVIRRAEDATQTRYFLLLRKERKSNAEFKELEFLGRQMERWARIEARYGGQDGLDRDLGERIPGIDRGPQRRSYKKREKAKSNYFPPEAVAKVREYLRDHEFGYQRMWREQLAARIRNILKSRQIGATYYFAGEALLRAFDGDPSLFLSASKSQAQVFRSYIIQFAREAADIELKGGMDRPLIIRTDEHAVDLNFLGTNTRTAQSYHGHVYMDEYFWIPDFVMFNKVASGMAMHKRWTKTYMSTPSTVNHPAYPFWTGDHFNRGRQADQRIALDVSHAALRDGRTDPDRQWRHMVTVEDALAGGCDLFDIEDLRLEYSPEEFRNLLMCEFIDDNASLFPLDKLQACMVDTWEVWSDFKRHAMRPYSDREVWVGYDPAKGADNRTADNASVIVVAPPHGDWPARVLEKHSWRGMSFAAQAQQIRAITKRYHVTHIGIDTTGIGEGVYQKVKEFFPRAQAINYSPIVKNRLVLRLLGLVDGQAIQWDSGWHDLAQALMAVRETITPSGSQVTYVSNRRGDVRHADVGWALMHALEPMPMSGSMRRRGSVEMSA